MPDLIKAHMELINDDVLVKALDGVYRRLAAGALSDACFDACGPILETAQDLCPVGNRRRYESHPQKRLRDSIVIERGTKATGKMDSDTAHACVGVHDDEAPHGKFIEFGTSKRSAHPFIRPAFDSRLPDAIRIAGETLRSRLDEIYQSGTGIRRSK